MTYKTNVINSIAALFLSDADYINQVRLHGTTNIIISYILSRRTFRVSGGGAWTRFSLTALKRELRRTSHRQRDFQTCLCTLIRGHM